MPAMSFAPIVQVSTNARGGCCWEVVLAQGVTVQLATGQEVARLVQRLTTPQVSR